MKLPKLYRVVTIKFWSLRMGVGSGLGAIFDIDTQVTRRCRRILDGDGWTWQLVDYERDWDLTMETDLNTIYNYGSELEVEYV